MVKGEARKDLENRAVCGSHATNQGRQGVGGSCWGGCVQVRLSCLVMGGRLAEQPGDQCGDGHAGLRKRLNVSWRGREENDRVGKLLGGGGWWCGWEVCMY